MIRTTLVAIMCLTLSACLMTRESVKETEQKRTMQDQVVSLQKTTADANSRFQDTENSLRQYNGRIEVLENQVSQLTAERDQIYKAQVELNQAQNQKLALMQEALGKMEEQIAQLTQEAQQSKSSKSNSKSSSAKSSKNNKNQIYDEAEGHFEQKDWKKAILSYQKFREINSKSKLFADATYKIGVCFQELKMKTEARSFYEEVIAKYPKSDAARRAAIRLKQVK